MTSLSISHVRVSREADPSTTFRTEEEPAKKKKKKNQYVANFQTTEDKLVAMWSHKKLPLLVEKPRT